MNSRKLLLRVDFRTALISPNLFVAKKFEDFTKRILSMGEFVILNKIFNILSV
jgi:hypothetical protein